jgi:hypothetical protein
MKIDKDQTKARTVEQTGDLRWRGPMLSTPRRSGGWLPRALSSTAWPPREEALISACRCLVGRDHRAPLWVAGQPLQRPISWRMKTSGSCPTALISASGTLMM